MTPKVTFTSAAPDFAMHAATASRCVGALTHVPVIARTARRTSSGDGCQSPSTDCGAGSHAVARGSTIAAPASAPFAGGARTGSRGGDEAGVAHAATSAIDANDMTTVARTR
jgi:hypothetical protein